MLLKYICTLIIKNMNTLRKCNDEIYQLAKDQALVKNKIKKKI